MATRSLAALEPNATVPAVFARPVMLSDAELDQVSGGNADSISFTTRGSVISSTIQLIPTDPIRGLYVQSVIQLIPPNPIKGGGVT
jgi:hypothetical protein